ncbi:hypothetical protein AVEN_270843-1, partial [Araneus ventricosus]
TVPSPPCSRGDRLNSRWRGWRCCCTGCRQLRDAYGQDGGQYSSVSLRRPQPFRKPGNDH